MTWMSEALSIWRISAEKIRRLALLDEIGLGKQLCYRVTSKSSNRQYVTVR